MRQHGCETPDVSSLVEEKESPMREALFSFAHAHMFSILYARNFIFDSLHNR